MSASLKKQDLPPAGGYAPINYKRIPAKSYFNGFTLIGLYLAVTAGSLGLYSLTLQKRRREEIEMRSSRFALMPMLIAEQDRLFLKELRRNRDLETELMKNVEGWEVGTLNGEPIYKTLPEDSIWTPIDAEWYAHTSRGDWYDRFRVTHMS